MNMDIFVLILGFLLGYVVSLVHKGITIIHKDPEPPTEYNKSPDNATEIQEYFEKNDGLYKF